MAYEMSRALLSLLLLGSFFFLLNTSRDIYYRNNKSPDNRLAALTTLSIALMFLFEYIQQVVVPDSWVLSAAAYGVYPASLLCAGTSTLLHFQAVRSHYRIRLSTIAAIVYIPVLLYFAVLIFLGQAFMVTSIETVGVWRAEQYGSGILFVFILLIFFSILNVAVCVCACRVSLAAAKKKYCFLISANLCYYASAMFMKAVSHLPTAHIPGQAVIFAALMWGITIRIFIIKYNFLPSAERKFELL
ncbi:hypothetical protein ACFPYJ_28220 [Paenibacillus solisilvae]|uniref:DUF2306 domain-containing protein n=1 Tax=Paenibacillus solisilvae TaxID=2486751 RepID=A0ABW0W621_9BACL